MASFVYDWREKIETAVVSNYLAPAEIGNALGNYAAATLAPLTVRLDMIAENRSADIVDKSFIDMDTSVYPVGPQWDRALVPVKADMEAIYYGVLDHIREINSESERWAVELRGLSNSFLVREGRTICGLQAGVGQFMDWHMNCTMAGSRRRKLAAYMELSNPAEYDGGVFEVFAGRYSENLPNAKGTLCLVPTYRYIRMSKVTRGIKRFLLMWIYGAQKLR